MPQSSRQQVSGEHCDACFGRRNRKAKRREAILAVEPGEPGKAGVEDSASRKVSASPRRNAEPRYMTGCAVS